MRPAPVFKVQQSRTKTLGGVAFPRTFLAPILYMYRFSTYGKNVGPKKSFYSDPESEATYNHQGEFARAPTTYSQNLSWTDLNLLLGRHGV